jgi:hypothetical protein
MSRPEDTLQVYQEAKHAGLLGKRADEVEAEIENRYYPDGCHINCNAPLRPVKDDKKCLLCKFQGSWHGKATNKLGVAMVQCRLECEGNKPQYPKECGQVHCPSNHVICCACCTETRCSSQKYSSEHNNHGMFCPNRNQRNLRNFL